MEFIWILVKVVGSSEDSGDFNFMYVRDGTIFTLEQQQQRLNEDSVDQEKKSINYGFMALLVFDSQHWRRIKTMNVIHYTITVHFIDNIFITVEIIRIIYASCEISWDFF